MEKEVAKPIHQEMINMGKQEAWYLFAIPFPGGTNAEYHYATVRIFSSPEQLESPGNFGAAMEKAHPGGDMEEMMDRVWKTHDLVKTHRLFSWENFSADDLEAPSSILQVVYFKKKMLTSRWNGRYTTPCIKRKLKKADALAGRAGR